MGRGPSEKNIEIMDRALEYIESLPYKTSLRNVFYNLLQSGYFHTKEDYSWFKDTQRRWRKNFTRGWKPDTLKDDTRTVYYEGWGYRVKSNLIEAMVENMPRYTHFPDQNYYVEIWFESRAMADQFRYHSDGIPLRPFGGDYTVEPKWRTAKELEEVYEAWEKPIKILYFGDCDTKGKIIPYSAYKDIEGWCQYEIDFEVIGLTLQQARDFNLPLNPDKPTEYQWEALNDEQASNLIHGAVYKYIDQDLITSAREKRAELQEEIKEKLMH